MAIAIMGILESFKIPQHIDEIILTLSHIYSVATLKKLLSYMIDTHMIIEEKDAASLADCENSFLDKAFFYTSSGMGLQEIVDAISPLEIGIIGTYQQAKSLINELSKNELLKRFHVAVTDYDAKIGSDSDNMHITQYPLDYDLYITSIVKACNLVIAAFNYNDHYILNKVNIACFDEKKKWLRIVVDGMYGEVGPLFEPGETCCYACMYTRWRRNMAREEYVFNDLFETKDFHDESKNKAAVFSALFPLHTVTAGVASAEIHKHYANMSCCLKNQILSVNAQDFQTQIHYILKDYQCPVCVKDGEHLYA